MSNYNNDVIVEQANRIATLESRLARAEKVVDDEDVMERLAEVEHERWAGWMEYLFRKSTLNNDGTVTIPAWAVTRWSHQIATTYPNLSDAEKESDRAEVRKTLAVIRDALAAYREGK